MASASDNLRQNIDYYTGPRNPYRAWDEYVLQRQQAQEAGQDARMWLLPIALGAVITLAGAAHDNFDRVSGGTAVSAGLGLGSLAACRYLFVKERRHNSLARELVTYRRALMPKKPIHYLVDGYHVPSLREPLMETPELEYTRPPISPVNS